jgi:hypothetical protein
VQADAVASLIKFCSIESGLKILNSQSLRWSAPHLFGDPFELQHNSEPDLTAERLLETLLREALIMLFGPEPPTGRHNKLVNVMARWREQQRFCDEQEADMVLRELLGQIAELQGRHVDEYMVQWRRFARTARIACFAEKPDNIACWQRFADNHCGLALRFDCGEGTALPKPLRVHYQSYAPVVTSQKEQLDVIYGRRSPPTPADFPDKLLIKGRHDSQEMEWRCFDSDQDEEAESDDSLWYSNRKFPAHELRAVYFGAHMARADKEHLSKLLRASYPTAKIYQAEALTGRYELEFTAFSNR